MTDASLIEQFKNGNTSAFNTLIRRWEKPMFNFVLRHTGESHTAEDICQTLFIRAWEQIGTLRDTGFFSSWLYRIAVNLCRDEFRKRKRKKQNYIDETLNGNDQDFFRMQLSDDLLNNPEDIFHRRHLSRLLNDLMRQLPEEQREVLLMKQYQGLKFSEIAAILNEPVNTVKSRLYYGLRGMKKLLEKSKLDKEALFHDM